MADSAKTKFNELFLQFPVWEDFAGIGEEFDRKTNDAPTSSESTKNGTKFQCTTTNYEIQANPQTFVIFEPDIDVLWPGALFQGAGHVLGIGSMREVPIRERGPIDVTLNVLGSGYTVRVDEPSKATVSDAIGKLIEKATENDLKPGTKVAYTRTEAFSATQAALKLGLSAKYMGGSVTAKMSSNVSAETNSLTAAFVQNMFTITTSIPQQPSDLLTDDFSEEDLELQVKLERIGKDNIPIILTSVTYGRLLYFTATSSKSYSDLDNAFTASYKAGAGSGSASLDESQKETIENSKISLQAIGGSEDAAIDLIKSGNLMDYFTKSTLLTDALPISYQFKNINDLSIARIVDATEYKITECVQVAAEAQQFIKEKAGSVETNLQDFRRWTLGAASNSMDAGSYNLYRGRALGNHKAIMDAINFFETVTTKTRDDELWLAGWAAVTAGVCEKHIRQWEHGYASNTKDGHARMVYGGAAQLSRSQSTALMAMREKFLDQN